MAVYWLDPLTTTNGTGTYASPFSYSSTGNRSTLVDGDELRIKSNYTSNILDSESDTVILGQTNQSPIYPWEAEVQGTPNISWANGDIAYFPAYDTFIRVTNVTTASNSNTLLKCPSNTMFPIPLTATGNITVKRVASSYTTPSMNSSRFYFFASIPNSGFNGNTYSITDGWVSETLRVTDGTAVSLFDNRHTSNPSFRPTSELSHTSSTAPSQTLDTLNVNMHNSVILGPNSNSTRSTEITINTNSNFNFKQLWLGGGNTSSPRFQSVCAYPTDVTVNIDHLHIYGGNSIGVGHGYVGGTIEDAFISNITYNVDKIYSYYLITGVAGTNAYRNVSTYPPSNLTFDYNENHCYSIVLTSTVPAILDFSDYNTLTLDLGPCYVSREINTTTNTNYNFSRIVLKKSSDLSITYKSNYAITSLYGGNSTNLTSFEYRSMFAAGGPSYRRLIHNSQELILPTLPTGFSATNNVNQYFYNIVSSTGNSKRLTQSLNSPSRDFIKIPDNIDVTKFRTSTIRYAREAHNFIFNDRTVSFPELGGRLYRNDGSSVRYQPWVSEDTSMYKTDSPSLNMYLDTFYFRFSGYDFFHKIMFPVENNVSYTITGSVRTDRSSMSTGDCKILIGDTHGEVTTISNSFTSSSYNGWENFSLSYTAEATGIATVVWDCKFNGDNQNYWLDDLEIS